jgi:predicted RecA/RadA family phage recombinase
MAALSGITAARPGSAATVVRVVPYGATIAAGNVVYLDSTDSTYKLADANLSLAAAAATAIALTPGVSGGFGAIVTSGSVVLVGTTMAVTETYLVGPTAGEIIPVGDLASGSYQTRLGTATTATLLALSISASGIQKP